MYPTLADARLDVARWVDGGSCDNDVIDARINDACGRLLDSAEWYETQRVIRISTCNRCFALPFTVEKIIHLDINGVPGYAFNKAYQFLQSGPGDVDFRGGGSKYSDLEDLGDHHAVMYDIPKAFTSPVDQVTEIDVTSGMRLAAFSTVEADTSKTLLIEGFQYQGHNLSVTVPITRWWGGVEGTTNGVWGDARLPLTTEYFTDIERVTKPQTTGYITLYAVHAATRAMYILAKYHPKQTDPQFRRYRITNSSVGTRSNILTLSRVRWIDLVDATEHLPFERLAPVRLAVRAITKENEGDIDTANAFMNQALGLLNARESAKVRTAGNPIILDSQYRVSLGQVNTDMVL